MVPVCTYRTTTGAVGRYGTYRTSASTHRTILYLKVELKIFQGLALDEIEIVALAQDAVLEAAAQALQVPVVNVEHAPLHLGGVCELISILKGKYRR